MVFIISHWDRVLGGGGGGGRIILPFLKGFKMSPSLPLPKATLFYWFQNKFDMDRPIYTFSCVKRVTFFLPPPPISACLWPACAGFYKITKFTLLVPRLKMTRLKVFGRTWHILKCLPIKIIPDFQQMWIIFAISFNILLSIEKCIQ